VGRKKTKLLDARVEPLRKQIERWRQTGAKRSAMPDALWGAAAELAREHGVYAAARALRLSYGSLRTRTEAAGDTRHARTASLPPRVTFVELPSAVLPAVADNSSGAVVEVVGSGGQRLTVRLRSSELDLPALLRACWSGRT
jgi:hypothetical protein